jgi:hypothetical protein
MPEHYPCNLAMFFELWARSSHRPNAFSSAEMGRPYSDRRQTDSLGCISHRKDIVLVDAMHTYDGTLKFQASFKPLQGLVG